jgi:hypothetical protein
LSLIALGARESPLLGKQRPAADDASSSLK